MRKSEGFRGGQSNVGFVDRQRVKSIAPTFALARRDSVMLTEQRGARQVASGVMACVTVGSDFIARAKPFSSAFLLALGYELEKCLEGLS